MLYLEQINKNKIKKIKKNRFFSSEIFCVQTFASEICRKSSDAIKNAGKDMDPNFVLFFPRRIFNAEYFYPQVQTKSVGFENFGIPCPEKKTGRPLGYRKKLTCETKTSPLARGNNS